MAASLRLYRTYNFIDKDPIIDKMRTVLQDEGLLKKQTIVHELSGVGTSTLHNWFEGDTRRPQHATIAAVATALGYDVELVKTKEVNINRELKIAADWLIKQNSGPKRAKKAKKKATNGRRPS